MPRKIPLRQCVGCQEMKPKREMTRVVLTQDGEIMLDQTGKKAGRGAYLCANPECLETVKKRRALDRGLKTSVPGEVYDTLSRHLRGDDRD
ncbi:RNase P modulator RnpM [Ferroacidibacillus organovorans]|uniref:Nucleic acid-binding protein n=2 Tax=Ferroacidibacillus organovorans TaxID=1765683 RepID=A0A1V4ERT3_9BACL|nr:YlxR family protein [Ferroacidibacillus organovorans]OPG15646.1 nucleic acid-binding protein [Ferroacidibacillus organovorans]